MNPAPLAAAGYAPFRRNVDLRKDAGPLTIVLRRAFADEVTVTGARVPERLVETPASVVVLGARALELTPALAVDDVLRQVPGFTLFRRSGSRTANPTTQGASRRGIGGSGASRALVLDDGVPLNDPFGGWVYWSRVPRASLDRVEVLRGGASDLYGNGALTGVIHLVRKRADQTRLDADASYGSQSTPDGSVAASLRRGSWGLRLHGTSFNTDGYVPVAPAGAARPLGRDTELYAAAENLFDARYDVGRAPLRTLGPPRSLRAGVRIHVPGRP